MPASRRLSPIPIVLHVSLPYIYHGQRVHDAIRALQLPAVDGFNFNGGLVGFQQLDRIAAAAGLPCWHGSEIDLGILEAMYLHQCAAAPSCTWPSDIFGRLIREHDLLTAPLDLQAAVRRASRPAPASASSSIATPSATTKPMFASTDMTTKRCRRFSPT